MGARQEEKTFYYRIISLTLLSSSNVEKIFNLSMKYIWFNITVYETALSFIALPIPGGRGHWVCQLKDYAVEKLAF